MCLHKGNGACILSPANRRLTILEPEGRVVALTNEEGGTFKGTFRGSQRVASEMKYDKTLSLCIYGLKNDKIESSS